MFLRNVLICVMCLFIGLMICNMQKAHAVRLEAIKGASDTWKWLWKEGEAIKARLTVQTPMPLVLGTIVVSDKEKPKSKKKFEELVRLTVDWYTGEVQKDLTVPQFFIRWTGQGRSAMSYIDSTLFVIDEAFTRFTNADVVLATVHEIIGHHLQETQTTSNLFEQKETCAMACEESLRPYLPHTVDKWRLLRVVRALIDLKVNYPDKFLTEPPVQEIYNYFGTTMMSLETIVNTVTNSPGYALGYFHGDPGYSCACEKFTNNKHLL